MTLFLSISCSNSKQPGNTVKNALTLGEAGDLDNAKKYFTKGSRELMNKVGIFNPLFQNMGNESKNNSAKKKSNLKWKVVNEKVSGNNATVQVDYKFPKEMDIKNFTATFRLIQNNKKWEIDIESEMKTFLKFKDMMEEKDTGKKK